MAQRRTTHVLPSKSSLCATLIAASLAAAISLLVLNAWQAAAADARAVEFQRLVGGLGFGPALDLSRCAFSFDPRLCSECAQERGPLAGGSVFCPHHACSILYYPPLTHEPQR